MPYWVLDNAGNRQRQAPEDVADFITIITPNKTPISTRLAQQQAGFTTVYTLQDEDEAPNSGNAHGYDSDEPEPTGTSLTEISNHIQRLMYTAKVSWVDKAVKLKGVGDALQYEEGKKMRAIKKDFEARIISDGQKQAAAASNDNTGKFAGLGTLIQTHTDSSGTLSIANVEDLLQSIAGDGGAPTDAYCKGNSKQAFDNLRDTDSLPTQQQTSNLEVLSKEVSVFKCSFGNFYVHWHWMMPEDVNGTPPSILILDMPMIRERRMLGPRRLSYPDRASGPETVIDWYTTMDMKSEISCGMFTGL